MGDYAYSRTHNIFADFSANSEPIVTKLYKHDFLLMKSSLETLMYSLKASLLNWKKCRPL